MTDEPIRLTGTVKWYSDTKGYGFLVPHETGKDIFVHVTELEKARLSALEAGQKIEYEVKTSRGGKVAACNLKIVQ